MIKFNIIKVGDYKDVEITIVNELNSGMLDKEERKKMAKTSLNAVSDLVNSDFEYTKDYHNFIMENT